MEPATVFSMTWGAASIVLLWAGFYAIRRRHEVPDDKDRRDMRLWSVASVLIAVPVGAVGLFPYWGVA